MGAAIIISPIAPVCISPIFKIKPDFNLRRRF
jgi:hypothetical protein